MMDQLPAWNIASEYSGIDSPQYQSDELKVRTLLQNLEAQILPFRDAQFMDESFRMTEKVLKTQNEFLDLFWNLYHFADALLSVESGRAAFTQKFVELQECHAEFLKVMKPFEMHLQKLPKAQWIELQSQKFAQVHLFQISELRKSSALMLSLEEEELIEKLKPAGLLSWSNLYTEISGKLTCRLIAEGGVVQDVGISQALSLMKSPSEAVRKDAYFSVQEIWKKNEISAAAILNGLANWRLNLCQARSKKESVHFLHESLTMYKTTQKSLDQLIEVCAENRNRLQQITSQMASFLGKEKLDPWDLLAPSPQKTDEKIIPYAEALRLLRKVFQSMGPEFLEFFDLLVKNNWIDARILPGKRGGAYCTTFTKSREPRIFLSYSGTMIDVVTLAHEIGHGFHFWIMRDMAISEMDYPSTLAETASVFAENAVLDYLEKNSSSEGEKFSYQWGKMERIQGFLLNIPYRYDFEKRFYEMRARGSISPQELCALSEDVWKFWYQDSTTVCDPYFWAHKMHFSMSQSFYNYPYAFGYILSQRIYDRYLQEGPTYMKTYISFLRDTGRMNFSDIVQKYLGENCEEKAFWQKGFDLAMNLHLFP